MRVTGTLGSYDIHETLGTGGNGEVKAATGPIGRVAIKLLKQPGKAPRDAGARFLREVTALRKLAGMPGVLPLIDADPNPAAGGQVWYAMPIAVPLLDKLGPDARLQEICAAVGALAGTLANVHAKGVTHRDIKPSNLYWYNDQWCLGDFGLADFPEADQLTQSDRKLGPAHYIAPEMLFTAKTADGTKADVYSLGKTLWVIATGQHYPMPGVHDPSFPGAAITSYREDDRSPLLDTLIRRMTLLDPTQRPAAGWISNELGILAKERPVELLPDPASSLERLRAALAPHQIREEEDTRLRTLAIETITKVSSAIGTIATLIRDKTGLRLDAWTPPAHLGYVESMGGPRIELERQKGYSFNAGPLSSTWRLGIGAKYQMLSDGMLVFCVGYYFDYFIYNHDANSMDGPRGWQDEGSALNGSPSCEVLADRMVSGLHAQLPHVIEQYSNLVRSVSS